MSKTTTSSGHPAHHAHHAHEPIPAALPQDTLSNVTDFFKVLGDETRMRLVLALGESERCVSDLAESLDMTTSAVSHQLRALRNAGLVRSRREGKNIYYALDDEHVEEILSTALTHVQHRFGTK